MNKVFIDGSQGTTGLRIFDRLSERKDISLITLPENLRKDSDARKEAINSADIVFLCLPDAASIQAVSMANDNVKIIDTSTAHRTNEQWVYGFPELNAHGFERVANANRVAVPGCHASGFIALVAPLVEQGVISEDVFLTCHSITGYSGGGKKMIAEYEADDCSELLRAPRQYGLTQEHKHLKEMKAITGISKFPVFCPIVSSYYSGMTVTVPLFKEQLQKGVTVNTIKEIYKEKYNGPVVNYKEEIGENGFISALGVGGKDNMEIYVQGNEDRIILIARYDNLGKGASGAALECMNIMLGVPHTTGLDL